MKKRNKELINNKKGITLVALVVSIVVLLILAGVSIAMLTDKNGLIQQAKNAKEQTEYASAKELLQMALISSFNENNNLEIEKLEKNLSNINAEFDNSTQFPIKIALQNNTFVINGDGNILEFISIEEAYTDNMFIKTENSAVEDEFGNIMIIPQGFKILVDNTVNYTFETINITKGIVIEDVDGNQFVWIPVGTIYTNKSHTDYKTITLNRYVFSENGTPIEKGDSIINSYFQENAISTYGNATAKNITEYKTSVNSNGGYYIGRYEARDGTTIEARTATSSVTNKVVINSKNSVYNYIDQLNASSLSQKMYVTNKFTSDLINSYAWDTAIVFMQTFDDRQDTTIAYSRQTSLNSELSITGTSIDRICNIFDMASNYMEWCTETCIYPNTPCCLRGGKSDASFYTSLRYSYVVVSHYINPTFRIIIYM